MYFVTGLMVGDRRFPGATILGARFSTSSANHPASVPPTGSELRDGFSFWVVLGLRFPLPEALRRHFLTRCRGSRLLRLRRCGDFGLVSRHKPAEHRFLMFPLFPTLRRRASHAEERLRYQRFFTCRGAAAKSTPLTRRGAAARSTPLTRRGAAAISTPLTRRGAAAKSTPL